ncbi:unnamed protein product [Urochloa decumbens]|uniref:Secreted protein n=1 Tax=Urochloa decumbens TaxID=240449 RepID=A0ABC9CZZ1_9POAL
MKIVVCAVLMLLVISNCSAEMPPMMPAEEEHAELAKKGKAPEINCDPRYDPPKTPGQHTMPGH